MLLKSFYPLEFNTTIWMNSRCPKALQTLKIVFVYALVGAALAPDFRLLNLDVWELGISFKSNMASTKERELEQSKQHRKARSHQNKNIVEKKRKMGVQPNNRPSSLLGNTGKSTNFSFYCEEFTALKYISRAPQGFALVCWREK